MKIVALNGLLGYGYREEALNIAFSEKVDYLGVDAGSTDPGPYYLGSGKSFTDRGAVKRDLGLALPKALEQKARKAKEKEMADDGSEQTKLDI